MNSKGIVLAVLFGMVMTLKVYAGSFKFGFSNLVDFAVVAEKTEDDDRYASGTLSSENKAGFTVGWDSDLIKIAGESSGLGITFDLSYQQIHTDQQVLAQTGKINKTDVASNTQDNADVQRYADSVPMGTSSNGSSSMLLTWVEVFHTTGNGLIFIGLAPGVGKLSLSGDAYLTDGERLDLACRESETNTQVKINCEKTNFSISQTGPAVGFKLGYREEAWGVMIQSRGTIATEDYQGFVAGNYGLYGYLYF